jgi:hypothetical protein
MNRALNGSFHARTPRFDRRRPAFVECLRAEVDGDLAAVNAVVAAPRIVVESTR